MDGTVGVVDRVQIRPLSVDDYYRMAEFGILKPDERTELIEGQIVRMSPAGPLHAAIVAAINKVLIRSVADQATIFCQSPMRLADSSCPEPDFLVLRHREDFYKTALAGPADVLLLIEVADSSLEYDRQVKTPLYARSGIGEFWIVDTKAQTIQVHRAPADGEYASVVEIGRDGVLDIAALPGVALNAVDILV